MSQNMWFLRIFMLNSFLLKTNQLHTWQLFCEFVSPKKNPQGPDSTCKRSELKFEIIMHFSCVTVALRLDNCNLKRLSLSDMLSNCSIKLTNVPDHLICNLKKNGETRFCKLNNSFNGYPIRNCLPCFFWNHGNFYQMFLSHTLCRSKKKNHR